MSLRGVLGWTFFLSLLASACGGDGGGGAGTGASGLAGSRRLNELTPAEQGQLCDWMVAKVGSYGTPGRCPASDDPETAPLLTYPDQAACVEDAVDPGDTGCQATVAEIEACIEALPVCPTLPALRSTPECQAVAGC